MTTKARRATQVLPSEFVVSTTGNIDDLDFDNADQIRMENASLATIRGLLAGEQGQIVMVIGTNAQVNFAHQDGGSAAANQLFNCITSGVTPILKGAAVYQYTNSTDGWKLVAHTQGQWISVAYASGNFSQDAGTWTVDSGDQSAFAYYVDGNRVIVAFAFVTTSVSGSPTNLRFNNPNGYTSNFNLQNSCGRCTDNGTAVECRVNAQAGSVNYLQVARKDLATWGNSTNNTTIQGQLQFSAE